MPYVVKELVEYMPRVLGVYRDLDSALERFQTEVERAADDEGFFPAGNVFLDPEVLLGDEADRVVAWRAFEHEEGFWLFIYVLER
ncbi:MAG: hypothetical protein P3W93_000500 [Thermus sp.]|nr:hypothetical protein [Thermus sp.]